MSYLLTGQVYTSPRKKATRHKTVRTIRLFHLGKASHITVTMVPMIPLALPTARITIMRKKSAENICNIETTLVNKRDNTLRFFVKYLRSWILAKCFEHIGKDGKGHPSTDTFGKIFNSFSLSWVSLMASCVIQVAQQHEEACSCQKTGEGVHNADD